jgi:arsenate reductase
LLAQRGIPFESRDIFKQPLSLDELRALAARVPVAKLFSWKSPTARRRGLLPGRVSDEELLRLMAEEPRLIRRPIMVTEQEVVVGAGLPQERPI